MSKLSQFLPIIHDWKFLILKNKLVQPSKRTKQYNIVLEKHVEEKQPRMTRMRCSPSAQFTGKYNNSFVLGNTLKTQLYNLLVNITTIFAFLFENGNPCYNRFFSNTTITTHIIKSIILHSINHSSSWSIIDV